jgi:sulfonate dioxygenase
LAKSADIQIRVKWERGTVVVWDNRMTAHSALHDFDRSERRHPVRITPRVERPIPVTL